MSDLFTRSLPVEKRIVGLEKFAKAKLTGKGFSKSIKSISPKIEFYSREVKSSKRIPEHKFTNFIRRDTKSDIKVRIQDLVSDPLLIADKVNQVNVSNEKIRSCINLYCDINADDEELIFKSDIQGLLQLQDGVRVYSKLELSFENDEPNATYQIILIDPFHLVIPSELNGKPKDQVETEVYNVNAGNGICISTLFEY
jgi:hypothetical protein